MIGVIGYLCLDLFPELGNEPFKFIPGILREIGAIPGAPGGTIGNTGGALCKLGLPVRLGALIGDDLFASVLEEAMKELVGEQGKLILKTVPEKNTGYAIVLSPVDSDRMFLANRGVNDLLDADSFGPEFRKNLEILHFGYPPLCRKMAEYDGRETRKLFYLCRREGILTSLDLSLPSPGTFSYTMDWIAYLKNVLPVTDLFCPSIDEFRFMMKDPVASPETLIEAALSWGTGAVLLKMGAKGILFRSSENAEATHIFSQFGSDSWCDVKYHAPPYPVPVLGTTGAGDSAIAGFLCGIKLGFNAYEAVRLASRIAAYRIATGGSLVGIPPIKDILKKGDWK